jgi:hypothetical protein
LGGSFADQAAAEDQAVQVVRPTSAVDFNAVTKTVRRPVRAAKTHASPSLALFRCVDAEEGAMESASRPALSRWAVDSALAKLDDPPLDIGLELSWL